MSPQVGCRITGDLVDPLGLIQTPDLFNPRCFCLLITRISTPTSQSDFHTVNSGWWVGRGEKAWPSSFSYPHASLPSGIQGLDSQRPTFSPRPFCLPWFPSLLFNGSPLPGQSNVIILILQAQQLNCRGNSAVWSTTEAHVQSRVWSLMHYIRAGLLLNSFVLLHCL